MSDLRFAWDEKKNQRNKRIHGIAFEEAETVFYDENAILFDDPEHSEDDYMRKEYEIEKLNPRRNPYAKRLKSKVTMNLSDVAILYFKEQSATTGIPYQTLIDLYLTDCAQNKRKLQMSWK